MNIYGKVFDGGGEMEFSTMQKDRNVQSEEEMCIRDRYTAVTALLLLHFYNKSNHAIYVRK